MQSYCKKFISITLPILANNFFTTLYFNCYYFCLLTQANLYFPIKFHSKIKRKQINYFQKQLFFVCFSIPKFYLQILPRNFQKSYQFPNEINYLLFSFASVIRIYSINNNNNKNFIYYVIECERKCCLKKFQFRNSHRNYVNPFIL